MKVLVFAHRLEMGGTQVNAIELAREVTARGNVDLTFVATPGRFSPLAAEAGIAVRPVPDSERHPSLARMRALAEVADEVRPDLVHVWDWPQCFDAYAGLHLRRRIPMLCTIMSMIVPRNIPRHLPTTFGTRDLAQRAAAVRSGPVHLLEPPVDLQANRPGAVSGEEFRDQLGVDPDQVLIGMVCRLEHWLKLESLERGIEAVAELARRHPVRLVIVGEGSAADVVAARAAAVNAAAGREVVTVVGGMTDPRPAYAAADVMLGMGGSALRTLAFGIPLVVVGERGFSCVVDEETLPQFLHQGWYGLGTGAFDDLAGQLEPLVTDALARKQLGELGLAAVHEHYDLRSAAQALESWYVEAAQTTVPVGRAVAEAGRTVALRSARAAEQSVRQAVATRAKESRR